MRSRPAAVAAARDPRVERVIICTPDKDLAQCVRGTRIVQLNRRTRVTLDEAGVIQKFGVPPASIPDYLALVGDAADGYPGLPGWGAKSSAAVLAKFVHIEAIPADWREWHVNAANAGALAHTLAGQRERALLFRTLATLRTDIALSRTWTNCGWNGPRPDFEALGARLDAAVTVAKGKGRGVEKYANQICNHRVADIGGPACYYATWRLRMTVEELSRIDRTIEIKAPPERVLRALTSAAELSAWFQVDDRGRHRRGEPGLDDIRACPAHGTAIHREVSWK